MANPRIQLDHKWFFMLENTRELLAKGWLLLDAVVPGVYEKEEKQNFGFPSEAPITTLIVAKEYGTSEYIDVQMEGQEKAQWMTKEEIKQHLGFEFFNGFVYDLKEEKTITTLLSQLKHQQEMKLKESKQDRQLKAIVDYSIRHPHNYFAIRPMPGMGYGLIARQKIVAGAIMGPFYGRFRDRYAYDTVYTGGDPMTLKSDAEKIGGLLRFIQWGFAIPHLPHVTITTKDSKSAYVPKIEDVLSVNVDTYCTYIDDVTGIPMQLYKATRDIDVGEIILQLVTLEDMGCFVSVAKDKKSNSYATLDPLYETDGHSTDGIFEYQVCETFKIAPPLETPQPNCRRAQNSSAFFAKANEATPPVKVTASAVATLKVT